MAQINDGKAKAYIGSGLRVGDDNGSTKQVGLRTAGARDNRRVETCHARGGAQSET